MKHPIQPVELDEHGTARFKENKIVSFLLEKGGYDLNQLHAMGFDRNDWEQFNQLINYSVSAIPAGQDVYAIGNRLADTGGDPRDGTIAYLEEKLKRYREMLRDMTCEVFENHPDDFEL